MLRQMRRNFFPNKQWPKFYLFVSNCLEPGQNEQEDVWEEHDALHQKQTWRDFKLDSAGANLSSIANL